MQERLDRAHITANKNAIPFDQQPPHLGSGVRFGSPAATTRGMKEACLLYTSIGCVVPKPEVGIEEVKGRDLVTGLPKMVKLSSTELAEVLLEPAREILESIHYVLERTPPELVADISQNGIVMSGGGSLIYGIDMLVEHDTNLRTVVVDDPISCAAYGAGKMLSLIHIFNTFMSDEMQFNRTILGLGFSLFNLFQGLPGPLIGYTIQKKGARFCMAIGSALILIAAVLMGYFCLLYTS